MSLHRARARKNVRLAQISALGLVALAGLLAAMPAPSAPAKADPIVKTDAPEGPPAATPTATDLSDLTGVFDMAPKSQIVEAPKAVEEPVVTTQPLKEDPVDDGWPHFRYVGLVSSPRRTYALIIDPKDECKWVAPGEYIGEHALLAVSAEKVILANCDDTDRREYTIEARPEVAPADTLLEVATKQAPPQPTPYNPATINAAEMNVNGITEQMERERESRMKELEDRRKQLSNKNTQAPPTRGTPASSHPKPVSPQNKNANNKEPVK